MQLPPELLDHIFSNLVKDSTTGPDLKTLKACNLTSSTVAALCEPHLYGTVYLACVSPDDHYNARRCLQPDLYDPHCRISVTRFIDTLHRKPHIGRYVRRLGILFLDGYTLRWFNRPHEWWESVGQILSYLERDKMKWFKLYSNTKVEIDEMPVMTRAGVVDILRSSVLSTLHIFRVVGVPTVDVAGYWGRLRCLDVVGSQNSAAPGREEMVTKSDTVVELERLVLRLGVHECVRELVGLRNGDGRPVLDLESLSFLRFGRMSLAVQEVAWSILRRARNLKSLDVASPVYSIDFRIGRPSFSAALATLKDTLQSLTITWQPEAYAALHDVADFIRFDEHPKFTFSTLTCLQLIIQTPPDYGEERPMEGWERTAGVVCDKERYPFLRRVGVWVGSKWPAVAPPGAVEHYVDTARKELGWRLENAGIELDILDKRECEI